MNGARMRSNSLSGTRPSNTSRSVPRLTRAKARPHAQLAGARRGDRLVAQFGALFADVPECL